MWVDWNCPCCTMTHNGSQLLYQHLYQAFHLHAVFPFLFRFQLKAGYWLNMLVCLVHLDAINLLQQRLLCIENPHHTQKIILNIVRLKTLLLVYCNLAPSFDISSSMQQIWLVFLCQKFIFLRLVALSKLHCFKPAPVLSYPSGISPNSNQSNTPASSSRTTCLL